MGVSVATQQTAQRQRANPKRSASHPGSRVTSSAAQPILRLQRAVGNRAISRLLQSRTIQPKLTVSHPDDAFEREADRVADQVMRMPEPQSGLAFQHTSPSIQRVCLECEERLQRQSAPMGARGRAGGLCQDCEEDKESEPAEGGRALIMQTKSLNSGTEPITPPDPSALEALNGKGQPLPTSTRSLFEGRMGYDFSRVRIHTDAQANQLARSVNARAFAHSRHLVFRSGEYRPDTAFGRHLLAHELTHTIQQGASSASVERASAAGRSPNIQAQLDVATPEIQRVCETTPPPAGLGCQTATTSTGTGTNISFGLDSSALSAADRGTLSAIAAAWHAGGRVANIRIDGFASCDGAAANNWRLSCRRAQTVALELEAPSDATPGIENSHVEVLANGETDQFSPTSLSANRRVVVTGGGTPPPGPRCGLAISGPDDVDHYCAAYVPSDAPSCGVFPAPNITLSVGGAGAAATLRWSITRGGTKASIVGRTDTASVIIKGDAPSTAQGDVTVQVTDGTCTVTHALTVREPSAMTAAQLRTTTPTFVQDLVTYTVRDQFGNPMGANICVDETVTSCRLINSLAPRFGDGATNAAGQVSDNLSLGPPIPSGIPAATCVKLDQTLTAGGCGPLLHNLILMRPAPNGVTLTQGAGCAVGDPCP